MLAMIDFVFTVRVRLLATEAGGRRGPIFTDYRPNWRLQPEMLNDGRVILDGCSEIAPGGEGMARLVPLVPEFWGAVQVGSVLPMCEGNRVVGEATVSSVARAEHFSPEVLTFVLAARRYCDFVDQAGTLPLGARLTNARLRLLEVYRAACVLPSLDSPEEANAPRVSRAEAWPGFEQYESYWEVFDPYVEDPPTCWTSGLISNPASDSGVGGCTEPPSGSGSSASTRTGASTRWMRCARSIALAERLVRHDAESTTSTDAPDLRRAHRLRAAGCRARVQGRAAVAPSPDWHSAPRELEDRLLLPDPARSRGQAPTASRLRGRLAAGADARVRSRQGTAGIDVAEDPLVRWRRAR